MLEAGAIEWSILPRVIGMPVLLLSCAGLSIFVSIYTFRKLGCGRAVHASSNTSSIIKVCLGVAWFFMFITLFFTQLSELEKHFEFIRGVPIVELLRVIGQEPVIYLVGIVGMIASVLGLSEERKQYLEWGCLEVDESSGDIVMTDFKIHVERIVRPILGTERRKMKMREELMEHLVATHAEAVASGEDDPIEYAITQLGDADVLQTELQDSVPRSEKFTGGRFVVRFFEYTGALFEPENEKLFKTAVLLAVYFVSIFVAIFVPFGLAFFVSVSWVSTGGINWGATAYLLGILLFIGICGGSTFASVTYMFSKFGLHKVAHVTNNLPSILKGLMATALSTLTVGLFLTVLTVVLEQWQLSRVPHNLAEIGSLVIREPILYALGFIYWGVVTYSLHREKMLYEEWGHLDIED